jgi:hypothetical protein
MLVIQLVQHMVQILIKIIIFMNIQLTQLIHLNFFECIKNIVIRLTEFINFTVKYHQIFFFF